MLQANISLIASVLQGYIYIPGSCSTARLYVSLVAVVLQGNIYP